MKDTVLRAIGALTVRALVTVGLTGAVIALAVEGQEIPTELFGAFGVVMGFWFGIEANNRQNSDRFG